ncbi:MAG: ATP-binding protein, partial [Actinomycetota bacterium]|nr:ATP-binding protein [Actinomycetota bacterium]
MTDVLTDFDAVATKLLPPNPGVLKAIGLNHGLESAIADLVDNSIDASAGRVLVRFVVRGGLVKQLLVVDNGCGMDTATIDSAMQLGKPKVGSPGALGHFGMGLQAASFSQASELTVLSRGRGIPAEGRRMLRESQGSGFSVEVLAEEQVAPALEELWSEFATESGTVIRWDAIRTFPESKDRSVTNTFVETKVGELRHHLGLMFHRLLEQKRFTIEIDVFDVDEGEAGFPFLVEPI